MERFNFNKKQEAALKRFEKAAAALAETGVQLLFDGDEHDVFAVALTKKDNNNFDYWDSCNPPENENDFEEVTIELNAKAKGVDICGIFSDCDTVFGIRTKNRF